MGPNPVASRCGLAARRLDRRGGLCRRCALAARHSGPGRERSGQIAINNGLYNPGLPSRLFKASPAAARAETATAGIAWLKIYTASPEFKEN